MEINGLEKWKRDDGDNTLALEWPIGAESFVWEIGGFEGRWAAQMVERYDPTMWIFEPQIWAHNLLTIRFKDEPKVSAFPFGLWTHDTRLNVWEHDTDGASVVKQGGRKHDFCEFRDIYKPGRPQDVDVCLMNIEGGEFVLLPYMLGLNQMRRFRYFWCQFHPGEVQNGEKKSDSIYAGMGKTHNILWDYYPTAVAWERR